MHRSLKLIKEAGCQAGLALNPATSIDVLHHVLDEIDLVLLMSVNPGFGGQTFINSTLDKCIQVRKLLESHGKNIRLEVDGGINLQNIAQVANAGADTFVAGSAIFKSADYRKTIQQMRDILQKTSNN